MDIVAATLFGSVVTSRQEADSHTETRRAALSPANCAGRCLDNSALITPSHPASCCRENPPTFLLRFFTSGPLPSGQTGSIHIPPPPSHRSRSPPLISFSPPFPQGCPPQAAVGNANVVTMGLLSQIRNRFGEKTTDPSPSPDRQDEKKSATAPSPEAVGDGYHSDEAVGETVQDDLHRGMKPRQLNMMAIAGAIGTGLILGTINALKFGPAPLLIGYIIMGFTVYVVMVALGEMGAWLPHKKSFSGYATRFVDPAFGFATGWNYFFKYVIVLPNNLTATGILIQYWLPNINVSVWVTVFGIAIILLNVSRVPLTPRPPQPLTAAAHPRAILWRGRVLDVPRQGLGHSHAHLHVPRHLAGRRSERVPLRLQVLDRSRCFRPVQCHAVGRQDGQAH